MKRSSRELFRDIEIVDGHCRILLAPTDEVVSRMEGGVLPA
jgi:hypothetical protein